MEMETESQSTELLPCPLWFCSHGGVTLWRSDDIVDDHFVWVIECNACGLKVSHTDKAYLLQLWNTRTDSNLPVSQSSQEQAEEQCPLTIAENIEGTWDVLIDGALPVPRLTQWTQGGAEETVRIIHAAYVDRIAAALSEKDKRFQAHTKAVGTFLSEMAEIYSLDVLDPAPTNVRETTEALLKVSREIREQMAAQHNQQCIWREGDGIEETVWSTECGEMFQFETGGPSENKSKFCCYCGKPLAVAPPEQQKEQK